MSITAVFASLTILTKVKMPTVKNFEVTYDQSITTVLIAMC